MCSLAPKSQWKEVKRRSEWEARDGQRGSAQAPVNGGLGGWGVLSCAWKWDNNHARTSFVNMLVKAFLSEIEKKFNFDKPSFWQKYWEWVNNSANSLIGKWFINQLWFFYICDSAEDTPQMYITYALYHHKGIPTTSTRTLLLHRIADANMGKSVGLRALVRRLHATLMPVHFSIGWSAVRPLRRGWRGGCYTVLLVGSLRPRVSSP